MNKKPLFLYFFLGILLAVPLQLPAYTYEYFSDGYFTSVHVLTVDPKEEMIVPVKATKEGIARETVAELANRYGASAAINGGFWKSDGRPAGILKINHQWLGTPVKPRGAIGWSQPGDKVIIDRVLTSCQLSECPDPSSIEILPTTSHTTPGMWQEMPHIVGGTPVLITQGNIVEDHAAEQTLTSFLEKRHPRTAVGIKEDGKWMFVVVDGSLHSLLGGMTILELADLMLRLGAVEALNLDGGGSSTMVVEGVVVNDPAGSLPENGKLVEAVSDALLVFKS